MIPSIDQPGSPLMVRTVFENNDLTIRLVGVAANRSIDSDIQDSSGFLLATYGQLIVQHEARTTKVASSEHLLLPIHPGTKLEVVESADLLWLERTPKAHPHPSKDALLELPAGVSKALLYQTG